jgi:hypothetical protein
VSLIELVVPVVPDEPPPAGLTFAPRRALAAGSRITLIDNGKPKGRQLLRLIAEELSRTVPLASIDVYAKGTASRIIGEEEVDMIAAASDAVITGLGDCGVCSACSLGDALRLEAAGVPATVVITDVFTSHIASFAVTMGLPGYHMAVVPHPVFSKDEDALQAIARTVAPQVLVQLQGRPDSGTR